MPEKDRLFDIEYSASGLRTKLYSKKRKIEGLRAFGATNKELRDSMQRQMSILETHTQVLAELIGWVGELQEYVSAMKPQGMKIKMGRRAGK